MLQWLIDIQRDIYLTFADHIRAFAAAGSWTALATFLPMGIAFGAVHAMTLDHSKSILATYLAGSSSGMGRSLAMSLTLSFVHVGTVGSRAPFIRTRAEKARRSASEEAYRKRGSPLPSR